MRSRWRVCEAGRECRNSSIMRLHMARPRPLGALAGLLRMGKRKGRVRVCAGYEDAEGGLWGGW